MCTAALDVGDIVVVVGGGRVQCARALGWAAACGGHRLGECVYI